MKLKQITKNGTIEFTMSDGRRGLLYKSGYVRVSVKGIPNRLYQINKKILSEEENIYGWRNHLRVLEPCIYTRMSMLQKFNDKNCTNVI